MQDVEDLRKCLVDAWAGVEGSVIQDVIDHRRRHLNTCIQPQKDIMDIRYNKNQYKRLN